MANSLFFVLSSRAEGLPLVIAEAMACRKAIIATNVDGIPDIVADGENGFLVPSDDAKALSDAIWKLYEDPSLIERFAARSLELAIKTVFLGSNSIRTPEDLFGPASSFITKFVITKGTKF